MRDDPLESNYMKLMLANVGDFKRGHAYHALTLHDDWCEFLNGRGPCNCEPIIQVRETKGEHNGGDAVNDPFDDFDWEEQDRRDAACAAALGITVEEMFQRQVDEYVRSNYPEKVGATDCTACVYFETDADPGTDPYHAWDTDCTAPEPDEAEWDRRRPKLQGYNPIDPAQDCDSFLRKG